MIKDKNDGQKIAEELNKVIEDIWIEMEKQEKALGNFELNNQQHVLLTLIIRNPLLSPGELAEKMEISRSAVSQQLLKLERKNYITKIQDTHDKRVYSIGLGEQGHLYKRELDAFYQKFYDQYYSRLTAEELSEMLLTFQKLKKLMVSSV